MRMVFLAVLIFIVLSVSGISETATEDTSSIKEDFSSFPIVSLPQQAQEASLVSDQIITVEYLPATGRGKLSFYQKTEDENWVLLIDSARARMGRNGIGKAKEGDGKTPSGTYNLTQPFGILDDPGTQFEDYVKVTENHWWCCNPSSKYYNQLVDESAAPDFRPIRGMDEKLINIYAYQYAIFIDYNAECTPKLGSAIFLHCKGNKSTTSGCIAVDFEIMENIMKITKPGAKIVIY
ncbi:MAG: L,D-transpeptidase family protein [Clostridia bacterium]|nr:L,D-transpeptidase family protein [Clostridia bacterium]